MRHTNFKIIAAAVAMLFVSVSIFGAGPGGVDSYEIYLNNKLLLKQFASEPLSLKSLQLSQANLNDQLVIYYNHCGETGRSRKIAIKDDKGNTIKEWKFANASGSNTGMTIAVKDLLQLEKKYANDQLSIFYTAEQLPKGRMLTGVRLTNKSTTWQHSHDNQPVWTTGLFTASFVERLM